MQEIQDVEALKLICDALNKPYLRRVSEWKNNSRQWSFCISGLPHSQLGFLYDGCSGSNADKNTLSFNRLILIF